LSTYTGIELKYVSETFQFVYQDLCLAYVAEICIDRAFAGGWCDVGVEASIYLGKLAKISRECPSGTHQRGQIVLEVIGIVLPLL